MKLQINVYDRTLKFRRVVLQRRRGMTCMPVPTARRLPSHRTHHKRSERVLLWLCRTVISLPFLRAVVLQPKEGLRPSNCVGVADSDYRGEYFIALHNDTDTTKTIHKGDRIAQMVVLPYLSVTFEEVDELDETDRGAGGFAVQESKTHMIQDPLNKIILRTKENENYFVFAVMI